MIKKVNCPQCRTPSVWSESNESRPFCSKRCQLIDLGAWASESYRIPGEPVAIEEEESEWQETLN